MSKIRMYLAIGLYILVNLIAIGFLIQTSKAGIFRPGKLFPLWRDRPGYSEPIAPGPSPTIPPPIIDPTLILPPVPQPEIKENTEIDIEKIVEALSEPEPKSDPTSKLPPWLPLGGVAGGGLLALLGFARRGLSQIKGD